jgi:hypothetical protein
MNWRYWLSHGSKDTAQPTQSTVDSLIIKRKEYPMEILSLIDTIASSITTQNATVNDIIALVQTLTQLSESLLKHKQAAATGAAPTTTAPIASSPVITSSATQS